MAAEAIASAIAGGFLALCAARMLSWSEHAQAQQVESIHRDGLLWWELRSAALVLPGAAAVAVAVHLNAIAPIWYALPALLAGASILGVVVGWHFPPTLPQRPEPGLIRKMVKRRRRVGAAYLVIFMVWVLAWWFRT